MLMISFLLVLVLPGVVRVRGSTADVLLKVTLREPGAAAEGDVLRRGLGHSECGGAAGGAKGFLLLL